MGCESGLANLVIVSRLPELLDVNVILRSSLEFAAELYYPKGPKDPIIRYSGLG